MNQMRMDANSNPLTGSDRPIPAITVRVWHDGDNLRAKIDLEPDSPDVLSLVYVLLLARRHSLEAVYRLAHDLSARGDEEGKQVVLACLEAEDRLTAGLASAD